MVAGHAWWWEGGHNSLLPFSVRGVAHYSFSSWKKIRLAINVDTHHTSHIESFVPAQTYGMLQGRPGAFRRFSCRALVGVDDRL